MAGKLGQNKEKDQENILTALKVCIGLCSFIVCELSSTVFAECVGKEAEQSTRKREALCSGLLNIHTCMIMNCSTG